MMPSKRANSIRLLVILFGMGYSWQTFLSGAPQGTPGKVAEVVRIEEAPTIDGDLSDSVWGLASVISGFLQREPQEGNPASERTEVRILYTSSSIFFGVVCYDSEPERILASERARDGGDAGSRWDSAFLGDDTFEIILDTFHSRQDGFLFRTNPLGTKFDSWISDEGRRENSSWDERWNTAVVRTEFGWVAEIEIPFKALRMPDKEDQLWGIDFKRNIRRKNEEVAWSNYSRDFQFIQVSQAGNLVGLRDISSELRMRVKPYATAGVSRVFNRQGEAQTNHLFDGGLEDLKYRITSSLTLDFTANPDFAQADVDDQVSNLTRFSVFFPEKREFFLENATLFDFGPEGGGGFGQSSPKLFHSRTIGLSEDREPIDIIAGLRLTGQLQGLDFGFTNVQTDDFKGTPGSNFTALRVRKKLLSRSVVGAMLTNRQSSLEDDYNRTMGLDANFVFFENLHLESFFASSETPGLEEDDWAARPLRVSWDTDFLYASADHMIIGRNFNAEMGFVPRTDIKQTSLNVEIRPRPGIEMVRQFSLIGNVNYITDQQDVLETRQQEISLRTALESGDTFWIGYTRNFEFLDEHFRLRGRVLVLPGAHYSDTIRANVGTYRGRRVSGWFQFQREFGFWGGDRVSMNLNPRLKLSEKLSFGFQFRLDDVDLPEGEFTSKVSKIEINYNFNNNWLTRTTLQYDSIQDVLSANFRLNWIHRAGDDLFLVVNTIRRGDLTDRGIILKYTHSFDF